MILIIILCALGALSVLLSIASRTSGRKVFYLIFASLLFGAAAIQALVLYEVV